MTEACSAYRERITAWVDGELADAAQVAALEVHLRGCPGCRLFVEAETATKTLLARAYSRPVQVAALRAHIGERLDAVTAPAPRRFPARLPRLAWGALAAGLLVAVTLGYFALSPQQTVEASPLVRAAVNDHVDCMLGRLPLELTTTDQDEVNRWLQERLARPVVLPALAGDGEAKLSSRWARLATAEGAQILVDHGERMLSLFLMPVREGLGKLGQQISLAGRDFFVSRLEGYTVVFWRDAGLLYCLVSDGAAEEVLSLATRYAGATEG